MPIKGLSDRGLAFPEIGQIRKGAPKPENKKGPGRDLNYFRVEFAEGEEEAAAKFRTVYGDKPQEINVLLPFNEIERQWESWLEAYTAGRMCARADGERFWFWAPDPAEPPRVINGEPYTAYKDGQVVAQDYEGKDVVCKPVGRLKVIVPELKRAATLTALTSSVHDIVNISDQLRAISMLNDGYLSGIPLVLKRRLKQISVPRKEGRVRMPKWMLSIEADPKWVRLKIAAMEHLALPEVVLLPDDDAEDEYDDEYIGTFYEQQDPESPKQLPEKMPEGALIQPSGPKDYEAYYESARVLGISQEQAFEYIKDQKEDAIKAFEILVGLDEFTKDSEAEQAAGDPEGEATEGAQQGLGI